MKQYSNKGATVIQTTTVIITKLKNTYLTGVKLINSYFIQLDHIFPFPFVVKHLLFGLHEFLPMYSAKHLHPRAVLYLDVVSVVFVTIS